MSRSIGPRRSRGAGLILFAISMALTACAEVPIDDAHAQPEPDATLRELAPTEPELEAAARLHRELELDSAELALKACPDLENQCFGAVGSRCGGTPTSWPVELPPFVQVGCRGDRCWTNAGSWEHDECCAVYPRGHWCGDLATLANTECKAAWERAVHRVTHGLSWRREVDRCRVDDDGLVDFDEYCAPRGVVVAAEDVEACCSGRAAPLNIFRDFARMARQGVLLDDSFRPAVCR